LQRMALKNEVRSVTTTGEGQSAVWSITRKWNKKTLTIRFLDGEQQYRDKVMEIAPQWTQHANLIFNFIGGDSGGDIRISFVGSSSQTLGVGTQMEEVDPGQPNMLLPIVVVDWRDENKVRRTILHEFGHARLYVQIHARLYVQSCMSKFMHLGSNMNTKIQIHH